MSETLTPVFRLEYFIVAAANGTPCDLEPIFNEEKYLHAIAGASVDLPMPIGRTQEYLAKLAGMDVEIPDHPIFRTEYYLAHMIDSTVECPAPIFREEMFYYEWASNEYVTITGNPVSFTAKAAPLRQLKVAFSPVQSLNGYDSPWPAGGGKNKLAPAEAFTQTINDVTLSCDGNGKYTLSGTATGGSASFTFPITATHELQSGEYLHIRNSAANGNMTISLMAASDNIRYWGLSPANRVVNIQDTDVGKTVARLNIYVANGATADMTITPSIEADSAATTYSPYSNLCPISGWDSLHVYDDPLYAGVIEWNQLVQNGDFASTGGWGKNAGDIVASDNKLTFTATAKNTYQYISCVFSFPNNGHKILITVDVTLSENETVGFGNGQTVFGTKSISANTKTTVSFYAVNTLNYTGLYLYLGRNAGLSIGATAVIENFMFFDLTQMFGAGNEPATVEEFKALFPHDYYPYNAGTETLVGTVNGMDTRSISISLGQTVYSGELDVVTGVVTVDMAKIKASEVAWTGTQALTDGTGYLVYKTGVFSPTATGKTVLCNNRKRDESSKQWELMTFGEYKATTYLIVTVPPEVNTAAKAQTYFANNESEFVYELATPITIQLTPQEVESLAGDNTMWSNANQPITVEYRKN